MNNPIILQEQGYFFVGMKRRHERHGTVLTDQMFVQYQVPSARQHRFPVVMVHGGGAQGLDYLTTPDGREGWATYFVRQGFAVYVVDRPGHGRSPYHADLYGPPTPPATEDHALRRLIAPERYSGDPDSWPQATLHTQWPGDGAPDSEETRQFLAGQNPFIPDAVTTERLMQQAGAALLDRTGPAIIVCHSMGGRFGWLAAEVRPHLVKAIVAVEPIGPPFAQRAATNLAWGLTATPLTYDPPARDPSEIATVTEAQPSAPGLAPITLQAEPARTLPRLSGIPVVVVTAEASYHAPHDHGTVAFLTQAGVNAEHIRLADIGIHGNGHIMMVERNSDQIAQVIIDWLQKNVS